MRILYIFPHPDDESYGPAVAISRQRRQGHEVYLLSLTKGGATKQRFKYGYSVAEMGEVRYQEMQNVAKVLDLNGLKVLDLPDSGLKEMDPREIERAIAQEIERLQPQVVVTYAVHGISGYHDHLVTHAAVKRVFVDLRERAPYLQRLAFFTIPQEKVEQDEYAIHLNGSTAQEIDCVVEADEVDVEATQKALDCYVTYQDAIDRTGIRSFIDPRATFEIFQEQHDPPLDSLFAGLAE